MPAPVSENPKEAEAAALFSRLLKASGYTHEQFAEKVGVSPGRVSQWATNRGAIPPERAVKVAQLLDSSPALLSPSWAELKSEWQASQPAGLDLETLQIALVAVKKAIRKADVEIDLYSTAPLIAFAYAETADLPAKPSKARLAEYDKHISDRLLTGVSNGEWEEEGRAAGAGAEGAEAGKAKAAQGGRRKG